MHLRGTDWILKLVYHEIACVNHWSESNNMRDLQFIKDGKKRVQDAVLRKGNACRRLLHDKETRDVTWS